MNKLLAAALLTSAFAGPAKADTYTIDPARSVVSFKIAAVVGHVKGKFGSFSGEFNYVPDQPQQWSAKATIDASSISTGIHKRDTHLQTADFLDVNKFGVLTFVSSGTVSAAPGKTEIPGNLTLHGVTLPVVLTLESVKIEQDAAGKKIAHAVATARLDRKDFGVGPGYGFFTVGKTVEIFLDVQGVPKTAP